jgi:CheY-like chemotaxis protein/HPt (histidine-containing phosphotransfer) domain-containing protein
LEHVVFRPDQVVQHVISLLGPRAAAKGISLTSELSPDIPAWIDTDLNRLRQILFNLVGNAIKFTEQGGVRVIGSHRSIDESMLELRFEVCDTGAGVPKEVQDRLFTRFTQADNSITRKYGGTGLGLAICKQLIGLMGGEIGLESECGRGSTFWFTIRCGLATPPPDAEHAGDMREIEAPSRKLRIVVAEDNPVNQLLARAILEKHGHTVDVAANGLEAVEAIKTATYDLVLMDVQMPEMDGITATKLIRKLDGPASRIPIIALTANAMHGQRDEYIAAGMDDYLTKPFEPHQLYALIARQIGPLNANVIGGMGGGAEDSRSATAVALSLDPLRRQVGPEVLKRIIGIYLKTASGDIAALGQAVRDGDAALARRKAHSLKSSSANLGATDLAALMKQVEHGAAAERLDDAAVLWPTIEGEFQRVIAALEIEARIGS